MVGNRYLKNDLTFFISSFFTELVKLGRKNSFFKILDTQTKIAKSTERLSPVVIPK